MVARGARRARDGAVGDRERLLRGDAGGRLRRGGLAEGQPAPRVRGRREERALRPARRGGARGRGGSCSRRRATGTSSRRDELRLVVALAGEAAQALGRTRSRAALDRRSSASGSWARSRAACARSSTPRGRPTSPSSRRRAPSRSRAASSGSAPQATRVRGRRVARRRPRPLTERAEPLPVGDLAERDAVGRGRLRRRDGARARRGRGAGGARAARARHARRARDADRRLRAAIGVLVLHRGSRRSGRRRRSRSPRRSRARSASHCTRPPRWRRTTGRLAQQRALVEAANDVAAEPDPTRSCSASSRRSPSCWAATPPTSASTIPERGLLRVAAAHGLPPELVGFEFRDDLGVAGRAVRDRRSQLSNAASRLENPDPSPGAGRLRARRSARRSPGRARSAGRSP